MPIRRDCPTGNILEQATLLPGVEQQGEEGGQQQEGGQEARRPGGGGDDLGCREGCNLPGAHL